MTLLQLQPSTCRSNTRQKAVKLALAQALADLSTYWDSCQLFSQVHQGRPSLMLHSITVDSASKSPRHNTSDAVYLRPGAYWKSFNVGHRSKRRDIVCLYGTKKQLLTQGIGISSTRELLPLFLIQVSLQQSAFFSSVSPCVCCQDCSGTYVGSHCDDVW